MKESVQQWQDYAIYYNTSFKVHVDVLECEEEWIKIQEMFWNFLWPFTSKLYPLCIIQISNIHIFREVYSPQDLFDIQGDYFIGSFSLFLYQSKDFTLKIDYSFKNKFRITIQLASHILILTQIRTIFPSNIDKI